MQKNSRILYHLLFTLLGITILFFSINFCLATELNVKPPDLSTGASINENSSIAEYLKYVFDFGMFIGFAAAFYSLVYAGILYLLSPAIPSAREKAKNRVWGAFSGLLILLTLYLIITTINPDLRFFTMTPLKKVPSPPPAPEAPGVYFYNQGDCTLGQVNVATFFQTMQSYTKSVPDLQALKKNIRSVKIVHNTRDGVYYIAVIYESLDFKGKCLYINPNIGCHPNIDPFASSASIYSYDFYPRGNITFFRKSNYDQNGGYYTLSINTLYYNDLKNLYFGPSKDSNSCTVPKEEQDCVKYDEKGKCTQRQCPSLAGENINSIKINGGFLVLLVYKDVSDSIGGPYTFCQAFPTRYDVNKEGPKEIKWEEIRNVTKPPNWLLIVPVENLFGEESFQEDGASGGW